MNKKMRIPKFFWTENFTSFCVIEHDFFDILQQRCSINISRHSFHCSSQKAAQKMVEKVFW